MIDCYRLIFNCCFAFFLAFLLTGCFPLTGNAIKKINVSDSKESVVGTLGKPYSKKASYNKEFYVYYIHDSLFDLFLSSKFPFVGFYPLMRTGNEYWIIFENDRVVAFGDARNFKSDVPRSLNADRIYVEGDF